MDRAMSGGSAAYSDLKSAWHLDRIADLRAGRQVVPLQCHLIISDLCNQDCHFCAYRMSNGLSSEQFGEDTGKGFTMNPNRKIPSTKVREILGDLSRLGVRAVQFTGGGEPTVHPDHLELFSHAQELGLETALVTNGSRLMPGWEESYRRMTWIRVSVDAGTPETYGAVRRVDPRVYEKVLNNTRSICEVIDSGCLLGAGYVVTRENWKDLVVGCRNLKQTGVRYVRLSGMFSKNGSCYYDGIYDEIKSEIEIAKSMADDSFSVVDLFGDRLSDLDQGPPDYKFCGYEQLCTYIGGNMKVYRCCSTSYTLHGEVGDLSNQSFAEWFASSQKHDAYAGFDARSCRVCQFNNKNRVINYMISDSPLHVMFT